MTGIELIAQERAEHPSKHGKTVTSDRFAHENGELLQAAVALLTNNPTAFPPNFERNQVANMFAKDDVGRLAVAGAFIAAHIDVLKMLEEEGK